MISSQLLRLCGQVYAVPAGSSPEQFLLHKFSLTEDLYWINSGSELVVDVRLRLCGGKGGFGSQLRAQGNKMSSKKRAGGYEACRDLSGRRIRTINQAKLISEYLDRKPELDAKRNEEIRDKMEKAINAPDQKPIFKDVDFIRTARDVADEVELAVNEAIFGGVDLDEIDPKGKLPVRRPANGSYMSELDNL